MEASVSGARTPWLRGVACGEAPSPTANKLLCRLFWKTLVLRPSAQSALQSFDEPQGDLPEPCMQ